MTINMLLTGLLAQAVGRAIVVFFTLVINIVTHSYEEFHSKNPVILGSCVEKNRDLYCFFFRKEMKKLLTLIFGWEAKFLPGEWVGENGPSPPPENSSLWPSKENRDFFVSLILQFEFNSSCMKPALFIVMYPHKKNVPTFQLILGEPRKLCLPPLRPSPPPPKKTLAMLRRTYVGNCNKQRSELLSCQHFS